MAYAFARLLGLPYYQWLRWPDDPRDEEGLGPARRGQGRELTTPVPS